MTMRTNFCKRRTINVGCNLEVFGSWQATRLTRIRTWQINEDTIISLEMLESFCEKNHNMERFYSISVEHVNGFDTTCCYTYSTIAEAWNDWNFMVGKGDSIPLCKPKQYEIINFPEGEKIEFPVYFWEDALEQIEEKLNIFWSLEPIGKNWKNDLLLRNACVLSRNMSEFFWLFRTSKTEFNIRRYGINC